VGAPGYGLWSRLGPGCWEMRRAGLLAGISESLRLDALGIVTAVEASSRSIERCSASIVSVSTFDLFRGEDPACQSTTPGQGHPHRLDGQSGSVKLGVDKVR